MSENENKKIDNIEKLVETIAVSVSKLTDKVDGIEERMATKEDIANLDLKFTTEIQDLCTDFKSFKKDNENDIKEIKNDLVDLNDTVTHYDKRIEKLENKVFV